MQSNNKLGEDKAKRVNIWSLIGEQMRFKMCQKQTHQPLKERLLTTVLNGLVSVLSCKTNE